MKPSTEITAGIRHDRFKAMQFDRRDGPKGPSVGKALARHWIFRDVFKDVWDRMCANIAAADWSKPQTCKSLFNDSAWTSIGFGRRIAIGRCLRYFCDHGMLPLRVINPKATGTKLYALS